MQTVQVRTAGQVGLFTHQEHSPCTSKANKPFTISKMWGLNSHIAQVGLSQAASSH